MQTKQVLIKSLRNINKIYNVSTVGSYKTKQKKKDRFKYLLIPRMKNQVTVTTKSKKDQSPIDKNYSI